MAFIRLIIIFFFIVIIIATWIFPLIMALVQQDFYIVFTYIIWWIPAIIITGACIMVISSIT